MAVPLEWNLTRVEVRASDGAVKPLGANRPEPEIVFVRRAPRAVLSGMFRWAREEATLFHVKRPGSCALGLLTRAAVGATVLAVALSRVLGPSEPAEGATSTALRRVIVRDDGNGARVSVCYPNGEPATHVVVEDSKSQEQIGLTFFRSGGAQICFGNGSPHKAAAWSNRDGTVAFSIRSSRAVTIYRAHPDGSFELFAWDSHSSEGYFERIWSSSECQLIHALCGMNE